MKARKPSTILMALILSFAMSFGMPLTALAEEAPENLDLDAQNIDISDDVNIEDEISNDVSTDDANSSDNALSDASLNADNSNDVSSNEDNADDNISTDVNINDENTLSDANIKDGEQNSANTDDADDNSTTDVIVNGDVAHQVEHSLVAVVVSRVALHRHLDGECRIVVKFLGDESVRESPVWTLHILVGEPCLGGNAIASVTRVAEQRLHVVRHHSGSIVRVDFDVGSCANIVLTASGYKYHNNYCNQYF